MTIRLGLQIPSFSYGTAVSEIFPAVRAQAQEAEAAGFDTVLVMDHFYQLPTLGEPDEPMRTPRWARWRARLRQSSFRLS
jgi:alkanesulfonate monooxygenase SsuD/methylene tetrahydromethanopterin reductase-like flavin-dependent oxidoreductase (luciferase family)